MDLLRRAKRVTTMSFKCERCGRSTKTAHYAVNAYRIGYVGNDFDAQVKSRWVLCFRCYRNLTRSLKPKPRLFNREENNNHDDLAVLDSPR